MSQADAIQAGAEFLVELARDSGMQCGMAREIAAIQMLEQALGFAYAEAAHFLGADPSVERMELAIGSMRARLPDIVRQQHFLMMGHKALQRQKRTP